MTGQLRTTLHSRADNLQTWDVDLDTVVRDGDRRVRRRRRAALAGGVVGVLMVAGGVMTLSSRDHRTAPAPADETTIPLAYAVGNVIHSGDSRIDVGTKVESMVRTARGFVFADPQQQVYEEKDGQVHQVGSFDEVPGHLAGQDSRFVVGDDGLVVAWWDGERIQTWPGLNGNTNSFGVAESWPSDTPPRVAAVSDGHMWLWDGHTSWVAELRPLTTTSVWRDEGFSEPDTIQDAAGDRILVRVGNGLAVTTANLLPAVDAQEGWHPGTDLSGVAPQVPNVSIGDLAPDADHWFTDEDDRFAVYDSASGDRQEPAHPGFEEATPYQWLGSDTIAALARRSANDDAVSLLTCQVSTNDCTVTVADVGTSEDVVVPNGPVGGAR